MGLRLGVQSAIFDDRGYVLLSQRDDLNVWNLPGGRLDAGETLSEGAAREVREETGIIAHIERPVSLAYWAGWQRMNILLTGWPLGGSLQQRTHETRANAYFAPDELPKMLNPRLIQHALAKSHTPPEIVEMTPHELRRIRRRLSWHWVKNLLRGQPEPRYPRFSVRVVGVICDRPHRRVVTLPGKRGRVLPRVTSTGVQAPWFELSELVRQTCHLDPVWRWAGVWQDAPRSLLEFVFAATLPEQTLPGAVEWSLSQHAALSDREQAYVEQVQPGYRPVWVMQHNPQVDHGDMLGLA